MDIGLGSLFIGIILGAALMYGAMHLMIKGVIDWRKLRKVKK